MVHGSPPRLAIFVLFTTTSAVTGIAVNSVINSESTPAKWMSDKFVMCTLEETHEYSQFNAAN